MISKHKLLERSDPVEGLGKQGCFHKVCSGPIPSGHSQSPSDMGRHCENRKELIMSVRSNIETFLKI